MTWDVAVLGAGPAGCATALALLREGAIGVCLVDPSDQPDAHLGETLPPDARIDLEALGLWSRFVSDGHEACLGCCAAWGQDALGYNDFLLNPYGQGWHLDRARFDACLLTSAADAGATVLAGSRFLGREPSGGPGQGHRLRLKVANGTTTSLAARFVVDATGARSAFARRMGATPEMLDRLTLIYGFFDSTGATSQSRLTMLEAVEAGWYAAALPAGRLAVAFAGDPGAVRREGLSREDNWFGRLLRTRHIAQRLDGCRLLSGSLSARVAPVFRLDRIAGPDWLAVGDAAASYDPLSSEGIQKALAEGLEAGRAIAAALGSGRDLTGDFARSAAARFEAYRANRDYLYRLETRWADAPFWRRGRERAELVRSLATPEADIAAASM